MPMLRRGDTVVTKRSVGGILSGVSRNRVGVVARDEGWGRYTVTVGSQVIRGVRGDDLQKSGGGAFWLRPPASGSSRSGPFWAQSRAKQPAVRAPRPLQIPRPTGQVRSMGSGGRRGPTAASWLISRAKQRGQQPKRTGTPPPLF